MDTVGLIRNLAVVGAGVATAVVVKDKQAKKKGMTIPIIAGVVTTIIAGTVNNSIGG